MNKQCVQCGHIMLVPDIPLPAGYTQKCIACGKSNMVADTYDEMERDSPSFDTRMDASEVIDFSSGSNSLNDDSFGSGKKDFSFEMTTPELGSSSSRQIEDLQSKIASLQSQMDRLLNHLGDKSISADLPKKPDSEDDNPLFNIPVSRNEALFCSDQSAMANICARQLRNAGIATQVVDNIIEAKKMVTAMAFQFILVDQRMLHGKPEGASFLNTLKTITLPVRRQQIVALLTPNIDTGESQVFYQWGIDVNIHFNDLEGLFDIIKATQRVKEDLYRNFKGLTISEVT